MIHSTKRRTMTLLLLGSLACGPLMVGCENMPGDEKTQGAVIGGVGGAIAGAALGGRHNQVLGALIGGAAGAGGGYLIGANWDKITGHKDEDARQANDRAEREPARPEDVRHSDTADLNGDGFVTLDEVVAMERAGLSDRDMIDRLERTNQYFELTPEQEDYLRRQGVGNRVIYAMRDIQPPEARHASDRDDRGDRAYDYDRRDRISD
jgi:hypothetical protein